MEEYLENNKKLTVHHKKPLIFSIDNFLTDEECDCIINNARENMKRAQVGSFETTKVSKIRTGSSYFLKYTDNGDLFQIFKKMSMLVNKPGRNFDPYFQVIHYGPNEYYNEHTDPSPARNNREGIKHRKFTMLTYLSDVEGGGETAFPKLGLKVAPQKGRVVYFNNYNKEGIEPLSQHKSLPIKKGEKWAFNLWYHDK